MGRLGPRELQGIGKILRVSHPIPQLTNRTKVGCFRRSDRSMALLLCSWPSNNDTSSITTIVEYLEKEGAYSRAAALAVFNLQVPLAIEVLNRAPVEAGLSYVGIALAGFSNEEDSNWRKFCATALKKIADPYLKAMFSFLLSEGHNYDGVLVSRLTCFSFLA